MCVVRPSVCLSESSVASVDHWTVDLSVCAKLWSGAEPWSGVVFGVGFFVVEIGVNFLQYLQWM